MTHGYVVALALLIALIVVVGLCVYVVRKRKKTRALHKTIAAIGGTEHVLLLMNADSTVAHEVTWYREIPHAHVYGGRTFTRSRVRPDGSVEFKCQP